MQTLKETIDSPNSRNRCDVHPATALSAADVSTAAAAAAIAATAAAVVVVVVVAQEMAHLGWGDDDRVSSMNP